MNDNDKITAPWRPISEWTRSAAISPYIHITANGAVGWDYGDEAPLSGITHFMWVWDARDFLGNFPPPKEPKFKKGDVVTRKGSALYPWIVEECTDTTVKFYGIPYAERNIDDFGKVGEATVWLPPSSPNGSGGAERQIGTAMLEQQ